ncbi:MAG: succinylglutamate desuccinylase/aspartoacylase family protein [Planctomycetota bacterium]
MTPAADSELWCGKRIAPGERASVSLSVSESYMGATTRIPVHVWRAPEPGPKVLVTAAVHGDEINGTGAIRSLLVDPPFELERGTLVLAPVVNVLGFVRHERYLPDRRDLNRCFPGNRRGSTASRLARIVFDRLVRRCDYGIDLHTAAVRRTNYPNVRADLDDVEARRIARVFGAEVVIDAEGPEGSLRRTATEAGCSTIVVEAGEVWKVEPSVVEFVLNGIRNVLIEVGAISGVPVRGPFRCVARSTKWIRAQSGGFLEFHVSPGDLLEVGAPIATSTTLLGERPELLVAPVGGLVIGQTTSPSVSPGDPVVHLALPDPDALPRIERAIEGLAVDSLAGRLRSDLASNLLMTEPRLDEDGLIETPPEDEDSPL